MHDFDWFSLMRGITEMHVKSLKNSCGTTDKPRGVHQSETYDARLASPMPQEHSLPDSSVSGNEGVGGTVEGHGLRLSESLSSETCTVDEGHYAENANGRQPEAECSSRHSEYQASPADSPISSPLYLLSSEIVDLVELSEQYRAEEEAAAEEGAEIEASGYQFPEYERNGRY